MSCVPFLLLGMTLLLPATSLRPAEARGTVHVHSRRKRDIPSTNMELQDLQESVGNRLADFRKHACSLKWSKECDDLQAALAFLGFLPADSWKSSRMIAKKKKDCAFSLGNHCLTDSLDAAASEYGYLQSGSSPGRRRRRSSRSSSSSSSRQKAITTSTTTLFRHHPLSELGKGEREEWVDAEGAN